MRGGHAMRGGTSRPMSYYRIAVRYLSSMGSSPVTVICVCALCRAGHARGRARCGVGGVRWRLGGGGASSLVQCAVPLPVGPEPRRAAVAGVVPLASWRAGVLVPVRHRRGHDEVARSLGLSEVEYDYRDRIARRPAVV